MTIANSAFYTGSIRHRRFHPKQHRFTYRCYMTAIDPDELRELANISPWFGVNRFAPVSWYRRDFIRSQPATLSLREAVWLQIHTSGGTLQSSEQGRILQLANLRNFGVHFSPVNFYFAFDRTDQLCYLLAEVTNTPWLEQQYYLIDLRHPEPNEKVFPVSPFMHLDMKYLWRIRYSPKQILIHIENHTDEKIFDAMLQLQHQSFERTSAYFLLRYWSVMTLKIVGGIYWQALRLFLKGMPFFGHMTQKGKTDGR
jgi:DUF1365 family protein